MIKPLEPPQDAQDYRNLFLENRIKINELVTIFNILIEQIPYLGAAIEKQMPDTPPMTPVTGETHALRDDTALLGALLDDDTDDKADMKDTAITAAEMDAGAAANKEDTTEPTTAPESPAGTSKGVDADEPTTDTC